jgi:DNA ligase-1
MLAQTAESVAVAGAKTGEAAVEWKVDGARVQVHRQGDEVRVFTRNLRDIARSAHEVVRAAASLNVDSIILDGEAVANLGLSNLG